MRVMLMQENTAASHFLRAAMWSHWSHAALVRADWTVIESRMRVGVQRTAAWNLIRAASEYELLEVACDDFRAWQFAEAQIGKPYDLSAVLGIGLHRDWDADDKWFCSELVAAALMAGGVNVLRKPTARVTPQDLYESALLKVIE